MISKKEKKAIFISLISLTLVAIISITAIIFIRKNKAKNNSPANNANQVSSNLSNLAIAEQRIPPNYNGVYQFNTIKSIEFDSKLTKQEIQALYNNKNITDKNELFDLLKQEKIDARDNNGELLVLQNGNINKTIGDNKNRVPIKDSAGKYIGDDNLSLIVINSTNEKLYMSLNYTTKTDAISVSYNSKSNGAKLYIFKQICSKYDPSLVLINVTYEYNLYVTENEIDEKLYDFI